MLVPSFFVHQGVVQRSVALFFPHIEMRSRVIVGSNTYWISSFVHDQSSLPYSSSIYCYGDSLDIKNAFSTCYESNDLTMRYRHPATCPCCHFSFRSRRIWYCFRRVLYSRIKSLTSPSSPSRKLVASVSESNSDSVVRISSFEYKAGGENGCNQLGPGMTVSTFNAWSISACFACHCFSSSLASANFSSAALRAWRISSCRERIRSAC